MVLSEKDFLLELESDKKTLKSLFSKAGQYDCPCRRKNMTDDDWKKYKNGYMQKVWKLLHERSFKYLDNPSNETKEKVFKFYNNDVKSIPCYVCRKHYTEFISKNNLKNACESRDKLCKFLIDLHNDVNKDTKKPIMSYQDVYKLYGYQYNVFSYPVSKNPVKLEIMEKKPIKLEVVKKEPEPLNLKIVEKNSIKLEPRKKEPIKLEFIERKPIKLESTKFEPIKLEPRKKEPIKLEFIERKPIDLEPVTNVTQDYASYLLELNKKVTYNNSMNNIHNSRNNIIKQGMMRAINRGRKYNK